VYSILDLLIRIYQVCSIYFKSSMSNLMFSHFLSLRISRDTAALHIKQVISDYRRLFVLNRSFMCTISKFWYPTLLTTSALYDVLCIFGTVRYTGRLGGVKNIIHPFGFFDALLVVYIVLSMSSAVWHSSSQCVNNLQLSTYYKLRGKGKRLNKILFRQIQSLNKYGIPVAVFHSVKPIFLLNYFLIVTCGALFLLLGVVPVPKR